MQPAAILRVLVDADTGGASANLKRFDRQVRNTGETSKRATTNVDRMNPALLRMGSSAGRASREMKRLSPGLSSLTTRIPVLKFAAIGAAIQAAIPPVVALTSALGPLTGLLGALPGLATAAAQGIGTIALGFSGIGTAVKDAFALQKTAAKDATSSLQAHRAAAEAVRSAIQNVGDAERGLVDAQHDAKRAQEDLSQARREATRELIDMRLAAQGASLSEKEARLELTQAIADQVAVMDDASSTSADIREADLKVQRARLGLKESTVESKRAQEDYTSAQKKGVRGSDQVVSAQDALHNAQRKVADSQRALVDATRQVRLAQLEQAESAGQAAGGVAKLQQSMEGLPSAAKNFVRFIVDLKPRLDSLRAAAASGIFPGLTRGIKSAMQNFGVVRNVIASTADALGDLAEQAGKRIGGREWGRDLQTQGERNVVTITRLGGATLNLADGFRHIMLAAGPLVSFLTGAAAKFSEIFASWAKGARESGQLDAFFQKTIKTTAITVKAFWDFGRALINIGKIASRVWGNDLLKGIGDVAQQFRDWTESVRGQRAIEGYFVRWRKRWEDIAHAVGEVIGEYNRLRRAGKSVADAFTTVFADTLAKVIPQIAGQGFEIGRALVSGIVRGFFNADLLGKAVIASYLAFRLKLLKPLFFGFGATAGAEVGAGVAAGVTGSAAGQAAVGRMMGTRVAEAAGGAAAGGMLKNFGGKLLPFAKKAGMVGVGLVLADQVMGAFKDRAARKGADAFAALKVEAKGAGVNVPVLGKVDVPGLGAFRKLSGLGPLPDQFSGSTKAAKELLPVLQDIADKSKAISPKRAQELRDQLARISGISKEARHGLLSVVDAAANRGHKIGEIKNEFDRFRAGSVTTLRQLRKETANQFDAIAELMGSRTKKGREALQTQFSLSLGQIVLFKKRGVVNMRQAGDTIRDLMTQRTAQGKDHWAKNLLAAERAIAATMSRSGKITRQGTDLIRALMVNAMKNMGLSPDTIRMSLNKRESAKKGFTQPGQTGMIVRGGKPAGDSVHALLERGEVVVNRKAVQKLGGPAEVDKLNRVIPRFQEGGPVGFRRGGRADRVKVAQPNFGGHPSNVSAGVAKLIGVMQGKFPGLMVSSTTDHPYLTTSGNVSDHASGHAVDLSSGDYGYMNKAAAWVRSSGLFHQISQGIHNPNLAIADGAIQTPPGQYAGHTWTEHLDHIHLAVAGALKAAGLGGGATGAAPKLAQLAVSGGGAMGTLVEGGLGKVRAAAQHKLNRLAARAGGVGREKGLGVSTGPLPAPGIASRQQMVKWATKALHSTGHGAPPDAIEKILTLAQKESGWNTHSINLWDSNAKAGNPSVGLMQVTIDKMGMHWPEDQDNPRLWDPVANMIASINYQFGRYGGLTTQSPYAKGGIVGMASGGVAGASSDADNLEREIRRTIRRIHKDERAIRRLERGGLHGDEVPHAHALKVDLKKQHEWLQGLNRKLREGDTSGFPGNEVHPAMLGGIVSALAKGGIVGYAGDSLGVGTIGPLRQALGRKVEGHPSSGKTSSWGVGQLIKNAAQHVFDFGTNDATGAAIRASINAVDTKTGKKPVHVMTVNGTPPGGQSAELKNKAIRAAAHGDVRLVDWAGKHKGQLDALGHGAYPERARLIAESIRRATGAEGRAGAPDGKDGKTPKVGKPFKGPLGRVLKKTLSSLRHTKDAKARGTRLKQFEKRIRKDLGLPTKLQDQMKFVSGAAELFGQRADNAAALNVENGDGTTTLGVLAGKDQGGWLNDQLGALLTWRNMILDATAIIEKRRKQAAELLEKARKRLALLKAHIKSVTKFQDKQRDQLKELRKKPKVNKAKIESLRGVIMQGEAWLGGMKREETGLETIVPTLKGRITSLTGENGLAGLSTNLVDLQGIGGPLNKIKGIPTLGQIPGGSIFDVQVSLRDLATQATERASDSPVTDETSVELLKQLLREANLRTTVSQRQYDVLKNFDATSGAGPFMGAFAKGGVALVGERGPELAHLPSGTRVHSASDTEQMLAPNIAVHINGDIVNTPRGKDPVEVLLNDRRFKAAIGNSRLGGRAPLPGRGGGGF